MTKQELLKKLKELGACAIALRWAIEQSNIETILEDCPLHWRLWALNNRLFEFTKHCNWENLNGENWTWLLCHQPRFAEHCDWNKLEGNDWSILLYHQPQFAEYCDWTKLSGYNWTYLLQEQPQLAKYCDWNKLSDSNWSHLLLLQPQLAKHRAQKIKVEHD